MMSVTQLRLDRWMDALISIDDAVIEGKNPNMTLLSFKLTCSYSHIHEIFKLLEFKKFINTEKHGREYDVMITKLGREVAKNIRNIKILLEDKDE